MTTPREDALAALAIWLHQKGIGCVNSGETFCATHRDDAYDIALSSPLAALAAAPETPDTGSSNYTIRASLDEGETIVREMEANALEQKLAGHWVNLDSPEAAEALARALHLRLGYIDMHPDFRGCSWCTPEAAAILAAMREAGR